MAVGPVCGYQHMGTRMSGNAINRFVIFGFALAAIEIIVIGSQLGRPATRKNSALPDFGGLQDPDQCLWK